ncbi:MAG: DNA replication/repair protein RecF [Bacteroidales bacterium]|nr:DNA replication/repair protein RecF [Bacteroidales bacterium]
MYLERLQLNNFKNYVEADLHFSHNVNCLVGNNGMGKTNLIDAIYYLSFCKSYFNAVDSQNIRRGESFFAVHGHFVEDTPYVVNTETTSVENDVSCIVQMGKPKQIKYNKKLCSSMSEHVGRIPLVMVSPGDHVLILGGSENRRRFVDSTISQIDKGYLHEVMQYNKAVEQRNNLLKQFAEVHFFDEASIGIWDEQLVRLSAPIYAMRQQFMQEFVPLFQQYFHLIAASHDELPSIRYRSQLNEGDLLAQLHEARMRDAALQYSSVGVHKDDFDFFIDDFAVKKFSSQGQQKTFLLALKLAQFDYMLQHAGRKPILLLDDIFDKLDISRVEQLLALVGSDHFGQVFLTDTQQGRVQSLFQTSPQVERKIFSVSQGQAVEQISA